MSQREIIGVAQPLIWEIEAHNGVGVETLRFATHTISTSDNDNPPNTLYSGVITDAGSVQHSVFSGAGTSGAGNVDLGLIELANTGELDYLYNYGWGRFGTLKMMPGRGSLVQTATQLLRILIVGIESTDAPKILRLRMRGRLTELDVPLLTTRYKGTTNQYYAGVEGEVSLAGTIKPHIWGTVFNVPGKVVNPYALIYQFCDQPVGAITVYDGGLEITSEADYPSHDSLINTAVTAGRCATCLLEGMVRLGAVPQFGVTADVTEDVRSASRAIVAILAHAGKTSADLDTASFDTFHAFNPAPVGIYVDGDATIVDVISSVADSVGGGVIDTSDGLFQVVALSEPSPASTVDAEFTLRDLLTAGSSMQLFAGPADEGQGVPAWSVVVNYGKIWQTQTPGDLAGLVTEFDQARKQALQQQWKQVSADYLGVKDIHPLAVQLTFDTMLINQEDAGREAQRRLNLYSTRRDRISFPVSFAQDSEAGNVELGRIVRVTLPRFGYEGGKNFVVLGRKDDFKSKIRTLDLWG